MKPKRSAEGQAAAKPLLAKAAVCAVALGLLAPFLLVFRDEGLQASIYLSELAMGFSLACLLVAFVNGPSYTRQTLSGVIWKLPLPFLTSCPLLWFGMMGYGLGGDTARSESLGKLLGASAVCVVLVPIAGAFAVRRGRDSNTRA